MWESENSEADDVGGAEEVSSPHILVDAKLLKYDEH